jgi:uncharacterized protein YfaT (DUF1175 family)
MGTPAVLLHVSTSARPRTRQHQARADRSPSSIGSEVAALLRSAAVSPLKLQTRSWLRLEGKRTTVGLGVYPGAPQVS